MPEGAELGELGDQAGGGGLGDAGHRAQHLGLAGQVGIGGERLADRGIHGLDLPPGLGQAAPELGLDQPVASLAEAVLGGGAVLDQLLAGQHQLAQAGQGGRLGNGGAQVHRRGQQPGSQQGRLPFQEAVSGGQYDFPDGLFFGGRALSWSAQTWRAIVEEHCRGAERVAHLDFHTGLGDYGACEIISVEGAGAARARLWYGDEVKSPERNDSLSAVVTGSVENAFDGIARETEVTSVALEYGTQTLPEVLEALRADNWLHLYGDSESDQGKAIKRQIRDAFYGDEPAWKRTIWETADRVVRQAAAGLAG